MDSPFDNIEKKVKTIKIKDKRIPVRLKTKDAGRVLLLMKTELSEADADRISDIILNMVKRGNPNIDVDVLEDHVTDNYSDYFTELLVLVGTPRDVLDQKRDEQIAKVSGKKPKESKKKEDVA